MTARLFMPLVAPPVDAPYRSHLSHNTRGQPATSDLTAMSGTMVASAPPPGSPLQVAVPNLDPFWQQVLESLPQGVLLLSYQMQVLYWNQKAQTLCQHLRKGDGNTNWVPIALSDLCRLLLREPATGQLLLVTECQAQNGSMLRASARWLPGVANSPIQERSTQFPGNILILLEDYDERLREEIRVEQKKYALTDREAEVWMLLRQEYSYQEVARMLQISLNTVKTHVKNVYAKKRSWLGRDR